MLAFHRAGWKVGSQARAEVSAQPGRANGADTHKGGDPQQNVVRLPHRYIDLCSTSRSYMSFRR